MRTVGKRAYELAPLLLVLAVAPWLVPAVRHYVHTALHRDAAMYGYGVWCLLHGQRLYSDYAVPDGPLIFPLETLGVLLFGPSTEGMRVADLVFHAVTGAWVGALLVPSKGTPGILRYVVWAIVGACVWVVQIFVLGWLCSMQRETYYVGIGLAALTLAYTSESRSPRAAKALLVAAGFLAGLEPLGKHTGVIYIALLLLMVALLEGQLRLRSRVLAVSAGVGAALVSMLVYLAAVGDFRAFAFWYFRYDIEVYRFQWLKTYAEMLSQANTQSAVGSAIIALGAGLGAWRIGLVPRRFVVFTIAPVVHLAAAFVQRRAWSYHFAPVEGSAAACLVGLMAAGYFGWERLATRGERVVTAVVILLIAARFQVMSTKVPYVDERMMHTKDDWIVGLTSGGEYLAEHTTPEDRVFYDGGEPLIVYRANRLPAAPYSTEWLFDFRAALRDQGALTVSARQRERILGIQKEVQAEACQYLLEKPAALVIEDTSGVGYSRDSIQDLVDFCPAFGAVLHDDYHRAATFATQMVFLRNDRS